MWIKLIVESKGTCRRISTLLPERKDRSNEIFHRRIFRSLVVERFC